MKPRPHGKSKLPEPIAPDIDPQLLLERESKAWDSVVEHSCRNAKFVFVDEYARRQRHRGYVAPTESLAGAEFAHSIKTNAIEFSGDNRL